MGLRAAALDDPTMGPLLRQLMGSMLAGGGAGGGGGGEDGPDLGALLGGGEVDDDAIRARLGEIQGLGQTQATPTEPRDTQRPPAQRRGPAPRRLP